MDTVRIVDRLLSSPATPLVLDVEESGWEPLDPPLPPRTGFPFLAAVARAS